MANYAKHEPRLRYPTLTWHSSGRAQTPGVQSFSARTKTRYPGPAGCIDILSLPPAPPNRSNPVGFALNFRRPTFWRFGVLSSDVCV